MAWEEWLRPSTSCRWDETKVWQYQSNVSWFCCGINLQIPEQVTSLEDISYGLRGMSEIFSGCRWRGKSNEQYVLGLILSRNWFQRPQIQNKSLFGLRKMMWPSTGLGEPTHTLVLVGCLNPCLQGTSVHVPLPLPLRRLQIVWEGSLANNTARHPWVCKKRGMPSNSNLWKRPNILAK